MSFEILDATIADIHGAFEDGTLTARRLVEMYFERIEAYDQKGPGINSLISLNPRALDEADRLDAAFKASGFVGPLHGIPMVMKDQGDVAEMPTTMGSVLFKDHMPGRDSFVVAKLKDAGAIFIAKATLGEMGAGDTHGSLFGSTRNVYDLDCTAGGSSGGPAASVSANFATAGVGQEGFASIRRPAIWNGIVGMRPTAGLVSRGGVYAGWPSINGSLGPMTRSVSDAARLLDSMVGYDANDPITARGVSQAADSYTDALDKDALDGARIGILRDVMGFHTDPGTDDFNKVTEVFENSIGELRGAGAEIIDPIIIPGLADLLAMRANDPDESAESYKNYIADVPNAPFKTNEEIQASPLFAETTHGVRRRWGNNHSQEAHHEYLKARELLMTRFLAVMADHNLDAIVHKAVEHTPTLIKDGVNPPFTDQKGAPHINTFLIFVPSVVVPAGFTSDDRPAGITFLGRPYDDANMLKLAYAYEQATNHRRAPASTP